MADRVLKNVSVGSSLCDIVIKSGRIAFVGKSGLPGEDMGGLKAFAGLIDIHTHGALGHDVTSGGHLEELSDYQSSQGVTAWFPTTTTASSETIRRVTHERTDFDHGARIMGFHMEGPYVSKKHKGAQNEDFIKNPSLEEFKTFTNVNMITLAPELPGAFEFIEKCGAKCIIGHSDADYDTALAAIGLGADCLTHTFNAMTPLYHRESGIIGAAIEADAWAQVICDGLHVHRSVVKMLYKTFGRKMIVISDSVNPAYLPDGDYKYDGLDIKMINGEARLTDGTIAGSSHSILYGVKKLISWGVPERDAFYMASGAPAEYAGLSTKGRIAPGFDADIILLDNALNLKFTIIGGENDYVCRD